MQLEDLIRLLPEVARLIFSQAGDDIPRGGDPRSSARRRARELLERARELADDGIQYIPDDAPPESPRIGEAVPDVAPEPPAAQETAGPIRLPGEDEGSDIVWDDGGDEGTGEEQPARLDEPPDIDISVGRRRRRPVEEAPAEPESARREEEEPPRSPLELPPVRDYSGQVRSAAKEVERQARSLEERSPVGKPSAIRDMENSFLAPWRKIGGRSARRDTRPTVFHHDMKYIFSAAELVSEAKGVDLVMVRHDAAAALNRALDNVPAVDSRFHNPGVLDRQFSAAFAAEFAYTYAAEHGVDDAKLKAEAEQNIRVLACSALRMMCRVSRMDEDPATALVIARARKDPLTGTAEERFRWAKTDLVSRARRSDGCGEFDDIREAVDYVSSHLGENEEKIIRGLYDVCTGDRDVVTGTATDGMAGSALVMIGAQVAVHSAAAVAISSAADPKADPAIEKAVMEAAGLSTD